MDANEARSNEANSVAKVDMKLEIVVIPVSDVDRAKQFYGRLGWRLDADYATPDEPYLFGRLRISGPDPEHRSYRSFASFNDPDGNGWLFQELTTRLARAHRLRGDKLRVEERIWRVRFGVQRLPTGEHEKRTGGERDETWPDWYAEYMVSEQTGKTPPQ